MSRPPLEVADIIRAAGDAFIERNRHWLRWKHVKVLLAIQRCHTAALGGHLDECTRCGHRASPSIAVEIGTARSVRSLLGIAGSLRVDESFSRPATSTWSSHYPSGWHPLILQNKKKSCIRLTNVDNIDFEVLKQLLRRTAKSKLHRN